MRFLRRPNRFASSATAVSRYDFGGELLNAVPAVQLPYIAVTKAQRRGPDLDSIDEKFRTESQDNLGKALKATDELWNSTMSNLKLLPYQKEQLNQRRQALYQDLFSKVTGNPAYFSNQANLMEVSQRMQNLVHSPDIDAMRFKTKEVEDREAKLNSIDGGADAYYRDEHGRPKYHPETGERLTNKSWIDLLKTSTNPKLNELLSVGRDRPAGNYTVGNWTGTMADASKETDSWAALAQASGWKKGRGGWELQGLTPQQKASFGTAYEGLGKYQQTAGSSSNETALATIARALIGKGGRDWTKTLSAPAVQGLTNHFAQAYQDNSFNEHFSTMKLFTKTGKEVPANLSIAQISTMARRGDLKDGQKIVDLIDQQEDSYVNRRARNYLAERVGARGYHTSEDMQEQSLDLIGAGQADKGAKAGEDENGYEGNMRNGLGDRYVVQVPQADQQGGPATVNVYSSSPNTETLEKRRSFYEKSVTGVAPTLYDVTGGGSQPAFLPGAAYQNIFQSFGIPGQAQDNMSSQALAKKMKVLRYVSDDKVPTVTTNTAAAQLNQQVNELGNQKATLQRKMGTPGLSHESTQHFAQQLRELDSKLQQTASQLRTQVSGDEAPLRHRVIVVMPEADFRTYQARFQSRDAQGQVQGAYGPMFGIEGLPMTNNLAPLDGTKAGANNPHNVMRFDPDNNQQIERKRLGVGEKEKMVQFEIQIQRPMQDRLDDGKKGSAGFMGQHMQRNRAGEVQRNVGDAMPLYNE